VETQEQTEAVAYDVRRDLLAELVHNRNQSNKDIAVLERLERTATHNTHGVALSRITEMSRIQQQYCETKTGRMRRKHEMNEKNKHK